MRKKDLLLVLSSVLVSLCIPTFAQQPYVMPEVLGQYVIEIGDLQEGALARPKGNDTVGSVPCVMEVNGKEVHQMVVNGKVVYSDEDTITDPARLLEEITRRVNDNK